MCILTGGRVLDRYSENIDCGIKGIAYACLTPSSRVRAMGVSVVSPLTGQVALAQLITALCHDLAVEEIQ
jgi:hypothetical protein